MRNRSIRAAILASVLVVPALTLSGCYDFRHGHHGGYDHGGGHGDHGHHGGYDH